MSGAAPLPRIAPSTEFADMARLPPGVDVLFAGPEPSPGAEVLREMQEVLHAGERHGAVCPRTSSPGCLASFPAVAHEGDSKMDAEGLARAHARLAPLLPRYGVLPAAERWPMLVRGDLIRRLGGLAPDAVDPLELTLRWSRYGYSTVVANRVLVHPVRTAGAASRLPPEYAALAGHYLDRDVHPLERFAPLFGAAAPRRSRVLFSFTALRPVFNGTAEYGLALLRQLQIRHAEDLDVTVLAYPDAARFHDLRSFNSAVVSPGDPLGTFDLGFSPCQILDREQFVLLDRHCLKIVFTLQDLIWSRCAYLCARNPAALDQLRLATRMVDGVIAISDAGRADAEAFYPGCFGGSGPALRVVAHGLSDRDAVLAAGASREGPILVVGNRYAHKCLPEALAALSSANRPVAVLGSMPENVPLPPNVAVHSDGKLPQAQVDDLYRTCSVLVFPSQYEGFGLPVARALAFGKPVVLFSNDTNREVAERMAASPEQVVFCDTFADLPAAAAKALSAEMPAVSATAARRTWGDAADDTFRFFQEVLGRPCDADRILRRREAAQGVGALLAAERRLAAAQTSSGTCVCRAAFRTVAARVSGLIRRLRPKGEA